MAAMTARTFADFFRSYQQDQTAVFTGISLKFEKGQDPMAKMNITVTEFKPVNRNTLVGFAIIRVAQIRLTIRDVAVHEKNGESWAQLPARPQIDRDGVAIRKGDKVQYATLLEWDDAATRTAFSRAVVAALLERVPGAFTRAA
jgi:hypothetical protein